VFVADLDDPVLDEADAHHLTRVLRLRPGETVVASDGLGAWRPCRFAVHGGRPGGAAGLEAAGEVVRIDAPRPAVTVAFVVPKGERPEWAVQKLTEVGVDEIVLLRSVRGVVQWDPTRTGRALERLRRVARGAAAQSRRPWLPRVSGVERVADLAARLAPVPLAVAVAGGAPPALDRPAVVVGPEGGWDPGDGVDGLSPLGLGPRVLRSETAAVSAGLLLCALRDGVVAHAPGGTSG
jgi:16S rRNA (uracil1498-N3)-methyltransferase